MGGEEAPPPSPAPLNIAQPPGLLLFILSLLEPPALFCTAETCTGQDLADLGDRLRDWFQLLRENSKQNGSASSAASPAGGMGDQCSVWGGVGSGRQEGSLQTGAYRCAPSRQILSL